MSANHTEFAPVHFHSESKKYVLGDDDRFVFQNHQLVIQTAKDYEDFLEVLDGLHPTDRMKVRTVSRDAADRVAAEYRRRSAHSGTMGSDAHAGGMKDLLHMQTQEDLVRAGIDPKAAQAAVSDGADPNFMPQESGKRSVADLLAKRSQG